MNRIETFLKQQAEQGKTEFRVVVNGDNSYYIHPMNKDGETFNGSLADEAWKTMNRSIEPKEEWAKKFRQWYENWRDDSYPSGWDVENYIRRNIIDASKMRP